MTVERNATLISISVSRKKTHTSGGTHLQLQIIELTTSNQDLIVGWNEDQCGSRGAGKALSRDLVGECGGLKDR